MKILTISGSLQARSSNTALVRAAQRVAPKGIDLVVYDSLGDVPLLNPDLDGEGDAAPAPVRKLRTAFAAADGILLASPEYGHSVPGLLKNALDWLVASGELSGMRVGLISASPTMGRRHWGADGAYSDVDGSGGARVGLAHGARGEGKARH